MNPLPDNIRLAVLNPWGRDPEISFSTGPGAPSRDAHAPVNHHAYAACMRGGFLRDAAKVPPDFDAVLVLVRRKTAPAVAALRGLRAGGKRVFIALKEAGWHQTQPFLDCAPAWNSLREICGMSDGAIASTPDLVPLYLAAGAPRAEFFPTPYPVDFSEWDFSQPPETRRGIFLGTREFDVPSRRHCAAVRIACGIASATGRHVTMLDDRSCPRAIHRQLSEEFPMLRWVRAPLPYPDYLRLLASHETVFQMDASRVPGQVAGDACLARVLCVGGDGAVERIAFAATCGFGRSDAEVADLLLKAIIHPEFRAQAETTSHEAAMKSLSFVSTAPRLTRFITA